MKRKVLILEDDAAFGLMLRKWFDKNDFDALLVGKVESARKELLNNKFSLVITDLRLPDGDGIMLLTWIKEHNITSPVIVMTSYAEVQSAVNAIKLGAFDYLEKPINPSVLKQKIDQVFDSNNSISEKPVTKSLDSDKEIVYGNSKLSKQLFEHVQIVAPTRMSVLITGESGTGKEYVAHMIHKMSRRNEAPFIAVDCGSLSRELAPSELFGHLKGSFTSAIADKKGVFEQADGGTVFLDEVGNLPYDVQVQLLRALQEFKVRPVGSATDIKVDVRIIVATNEDLRSAISDGRFREDLYHRLNEFSIQVPPLREREGDIVLFAKHFLNQANAELDKNIKDFSEDSLQFLCQYHWGGNLRELRNIVRRAALFCVTDEIIPDNLPPFLFTSITEEEFPLYSKNEKEHIENALKIAKGNKTRAAQLLKIDRKTLYNKINQYNIKN